MNIGDLVLYDRTGQYSVIPFPTPCIMYVNNTHREKLYGVPVISFKNNTNYRAHLPICRLERDYPLAFGLWVFSKVNCEPFSLSNVLEFAIDEIRLDAIPIIRSAIRKEFELKFLHIPLLRGINDIPF